MSNAGQALPDASVFGRAASLTAFGHVQHAADDSDTSIAPSTKIACFIRWILSEQAKHGNELSAVMGSVRYQVKHLRDSPVNVQQTGAMRRIDRR